MDENQNTQNGIPYPLDFDSLNKGDVLSIETLEHITGEKAGSDRYRFRCMALCKEICKEMEVRQNPVTARMKRDTIEILLDKESAHYNNWVFDKGRRTMRNALTRQAKVDVTKLSDDDRKTHDFNLLRNANTYQGLMRARRQVPNLEDHRNGLPGLPEST